jgi:hypothetical protein
LEASTGTRFTTAWLLQIVEEALLIADTFDEDEDNDADNNSSSGNNENRS